MVAAMPRKSNTRAAQGAGSIRQRANGSWEARYVAGKDPSTGKPIRKSVYGKSQKEARQKLTQAIAAIDNGDYFEPSKMTVGEWLNIWLAEYMGDKKYLTVKSYRGQTENHIRPALGAIRLSLLQPHMIQKFYNELTATGCRTPKRDSNGEFIRVNGKIAYEAAPMSAKTVRNIHGILGKALATAVNVGYIRTNPTERVTLPRVEKKELSPLTDNQVKAFLVAAKKDQYGILLRVILFTGLRESEALGLTWDCIDTKAGTIRVYRQLQKRPQKDGGFTFAPLKNSKTRVIKPASFVMDLLEQQRREQTAQRLAIGNQWQGWSTIEEQKTALVFTTTEGNGVSPGTLWNHFKRLAAEVGAPECRVHDLRHTFAVLSLQNGDDVKTVQGNLGHATAAFTLDVYGHISDRMRDESSARMQAYIANL